MPLTCQPTPELLKLDRRYARQAYDFLRDAMEYAVEVLKMGRVRPTAPLSSPLGAPLGEHLQVIAAVKFASQTAAKTERRNRFEPAMEDEEGEHRHLSGQELCEAIRRLALERFGYLAKCVFESWGLASSGDFGEMVFELIRLGRMRRTEDDRREDFDDAFDFETDLRAAFEFDALNSPE